MIAITTDLQAVAIWRQLFGLRAIIWRGRAFLWAKDLEAIRRHYGEIPGELRSLHGGQSG